MEIRLLESAKEDLKFCEKSSVGLGDYVLDGHPGSLTHLKKHLTHPVALRASCSCLAHSLETCERAIVEQLSMAMEAAADNWPDKLRVRRRLLKWASQN